MFESKFYMRIFYVDIFYKPFQLLMRVKSHKSIINIPYVNVTTKFFWAVRKLLFFKITKK